MGASASFQVFTIQSSPYHMVVCFACNYPKYCSSPHICMVTLIEPTEEDWIEHIEGIVDRLDYDGSIPREDLITTHKQIEPFDKYVWNCNREYYAMVDLLCHYLTTDADEIAHTLATMPDEIADLLTSLQSRVDELEENLSEFEYVEMPSVWAI